VLFGDLKTSKPGKVTSEIIKLATEDQNVLRYLFGNDARIAITETGESLIVTLKGSMRVDLSPTTTWPKLLDNRTGKSPETRCRQPKKKHQALRAPPVKAAVRREHAGAPLPDEGPGDHFAPPLPAVVHQHQQAGLAEIRTGGGAARNPDLVSP
jgi:hypothetical protein